MRRTIGVVVVEEIRWTITNESASHGPVNDERTIISMDAGANVLVISDLFAKMLRFRLFTMNDMDVQGIGKSMVVTTSRTIVKITLG